MGCLLAPATSLALGLGSIEVGTTLNQPLRADIKLVGASASDLQGLSVKLASPRLFKQVGIPRPGYLDNLHFEVISGSGGVPYIRITTPKAVMQPFLDFLVEVTWPGGQLLREYTVLLNPPNYMHGKPETSISAPLQATRPAPAAPILTTSASSAQTAASSTAPGQYRVKRGDTLSQVAGVMGQGRTATLDQMMLALVKTNPRAFINGNVNGLKSGYVLRAPSSQSLTALNAATAAAQVSKQNALWRAYAARLAGKTVAQTQLKATGTAPAGVPSAKPAVQTTSGSASSSAGHLKIMGTEPSTQGTSTKSAAGSSNVADLKHQLALAQESAASHKQEINDLQSRVNALQAIVKKQQALLAMKSQELASLQQQANAANKPSNKPAPLAPPVTRASIAAASNATSVSAAAASTVPVAPTSVAPAAATSLASANSVAPAASAAVPAVVKPQPQSAATTAKPTEPKPPVVPKPVVTQPPVSQPSFIDDLMSSPNLLMAAGGGILLLLALLWLVARRSSKARADQNADATPGSLPPTEDPAFDLADEAERDKSETIDAGAVAESPAAAADEIEPDATTELQGIAAFDMQSEAETQPGADNQQQAVERAREVESSDDVLAEADVYIAYGLYQQAEDVLQKALSAEPTRHDYQAKLLECHYGTKNVDAFVSGANALHDDMPHPEVDPLWIRVATLGKELVPDNPLFTGTDTGDLTPADVIAAEPAGEELNLPETDFKTDEPVADDDLDFDMDNLAPEKEQESVDEHVVDESDDMLDLGDLDDMLSIDGLSSDTADKASGAADESDAETLSALDFDLGDFEADEKTDTAAEQPDDGAVDFDLGELADAEAEDGETDDLDVLDLDVDMSDLDTELSDANEPTKTAVETDEHAFLIDEAEDEGQGDETVQEAVRTDDATTLGSDTAATNLDLAKAYIDMGDDEGARSALEEVIAEGNPEQKKEAERLLNQLS
ncbi:hypothetical protein BW247_09805 [Acidihalobacter ferrooxydans]|uniref:FimV N-terminal domain-containing protein n=2 Tax=Acidihalobacter ferrooxydans TaxID=1765967 RepID=A0A1P8UHM8_9GAMM|nr:hypothetical protein BW247_09805 [Acidihalobacter ferrooxydans]